MRSSVLVTALLLCGLDWSSGTEPESHFVQAAAGEDVTMLCSNFSSARTHIMWFRVARGSKFGCVSSLYEPHEAPKYCDGFEGGNFVLSTNLSTTFLKIKKVNSSDSGLYFCGYSVDRKPVINEATLLEVHEEPTGSKRLPAGILGALTVLLALVITCLAVRIGKLRKAVHDLSAKQAERRGSDQLDYASVTFHPKGERSRARSSAGETDVIYATARRSQDAPGAAQLPRQ